MSTTDSDVIKYQKWVDKYCFQIHEWAANNPQSEKNRFYLDIEDAWDSEINAVIDRLNGVTLVTPLGDTIAWKKGYGWILNNKDNY